MYYGRRYGILIRVNFMSKEFMKIMNTIVSVVGFISSIIIVTFINIPHITGMENLFLDFFSEWYCLVPVEFIVFCLCVYFFIKLVHKGIRFVMRSITKALGNESLEAYGTAYCLMVIEVILFSFVFIFSKNYIISCVEPRLSAVILFIILVSAVTITFIQSGFYLLFGWGYILLTKNVKCLPQILHGVICVEWIVLVITWCLQV